MRIYGSGENIRELFKKRQECWDNYEWEAAEDLDYIITKYYFNKLLGKNIFILTSYGSQYKYVKPVDIKGDLIGLVVVDESDFTYGWGAQAIRDLVSDVWNDIQSQAYYSYMIVHPVETLSQDEVMECMRNRTAVI